MGRMQGHGVAKHFSLTPFLPRRCIHPTQVMTTAGIQLDILPQNLPALCIPEPFIWQVSY